MTSPSHHLHSTGQDDTQDDARYVAISGGVGGSKLALGLSSILGDRLTVIANTGDDFEHLGLHISPDVDTTIYTLAGLVNTQTGWGCQGETWNFMNSLAQHGGPDWFQLGDRDLAMHVLRTQRLRAGDTLTTITRDIAERLAIEPSIVPMSDDPVRTFIDTPDGPLAFQDYFVRLKCEPQATAIRFEGCNDARPSAIAIDALNDPKLEAIIICPSNPYLSVDPILAVPGMRDAICAAGVPVIAVSPIIGGQAVKGPTVKIMNELELDASAPTIAAHYSSMLSGFVLDVADVDDFARITQPVHVTNTLMRSLNDKVALAHHVLNFAASLCPPNSTEVLEKLQVAR